MAIVACNGDGGDGGGDGTADPTGRPQAADITPSATQVDVGALDPAVFSAAVLRLDDFGAGFEGGAQIPPGGPGTIGLNAFYTDGKIRVQSSVVSFSELAPAEDQFQENRMILPGNGAIESNYTIPNMETAYKYRMYNPDGLAAFGISDRFIVFIFLQALDRQNPDIRATDEPYFRRLVDIVGNRMKPLLDDPLAVKPVEGVIVAPPVATPQPSATP
ncbi:MAG TPA: hypothetical protein VIH21_09305 [Dehalococcoidia bacterium]